MIVRLTYCRFTPDSIDKVKAIYNRDIAPVARMQQGNLSIRFIEPVDKSLVGKLADFLTKPAVLKTYTTEDVLEVH